MIRTPHYDYVCDRELLVVRWRDPSVEGNRALGRLIVARHEETGVRPAFVAIVSSDCPPPDQAARDASEEVIAEIYERLRVPRVALIGSGLRMAVIRSVVTVISMVSSRRGVHFAFDKSIEDSAKVIATTLARDQQEILDMLLREGMITRDELGPR